MKTTLSAGAADQIFSFWPAGFDTSSLADLATPGAWKPLAGDFDGLSGDEIGLYHAATSELYFRGTGVGSAITKISVFAPNYNVQPLAGDWDGNGLAEIGFYNPWVTTFELRNDLTTGPADSVFDVLAYPSNMAAPRQRRARDWPGSTGPWPARSRPPPPPVTLADRAQHIITENEVRQLLARAAAASSSTDAIIAIVDRNGKILGVRVEQGVLDAIPDEATRIFAIDGAVAKARTAAFFANNEGPLTSPPSG